MAELTTPEDGMKITRDTKFAPGVYYLPNGIEIGADGITLDGNGALLVGAASLAPFGSAQGKPLSQRSRGVRVNQKLSVTLRNLNVERFYHGIWVNASANIRVLNCQVTRTHEIAGQDTFLDVWLDRTEAYGGGIFFSGIKDSFIEGNDVQHQQNGIMLYGCNNVEIVRNNASFNSGYGILLYESSQNTVDHNIADYCSRMYHSSNWDVVKDVAEFKYHNGGDAAGLVMMSSSSLNTITNNKLRGGGDGVFLGGFHKDQIKVPCNDNVFENNDGSWSPNIAFEATFSERNIFRNNRADKCKYGFWLGYSSHTTVENNSIKDNWIAGVAIEHGHHNTIEGNTFERNREGVQLWVGAASGTRPAFVDWFPESAESYETAIKGNTFTRHDIAVHGWSALREGGSGLRCHHFTVVENELADNRVAIQFERVRESSIANNRIFDNAEAGIKLIGSPDVAVAANQMERV